MYGRFFETNAYTWQQVKGGCTLTRNADNKSAFFQGDDADLWYRNLNAIEAIKRTPQMQSLAQSFNFLCSGYDDILA